MILLRKQEDLVWSEEQDEEHDFNPNNKISLEKEKIGLNFFSRIAQEETL